MNKTSDSTLNNFLSSSNLVVLKAYADWCLPCKMIQPMLEKVNKSYDGEVLFGEINAEDNTQFSNRFGISGIPALLFFKDGNLFTKISGMVTEKQLIDTINDMKNS